MSPIRDSFSIGKTKIDYRKEKRLGGDLRRWLPLSAQNLGAASDAFERIEKLAPVPLPGRVDSLLRRIR
jgi:hypothetical protein